MLSIVCCLVIITNESLHSSQHHHDTCSHNNYHHHHHHHLHCNNRISELLVNHVNIKIFFKYTNCRISFSSAIYRRINKKYIHMFYKVRNNKYYLFISYLLLSSLYCRHLYRDSRTNHDCTYGTCSY